MTRSLFIAIAAAIAFTFSSTYAEQFNVPNGDIAALKAASNKANTNNLADTIHLAPFGTYTFTTADNQFVHGNTGLPVITNDSGKSLVIYGNGATFTRDNSIDKLRFIYVLDANVVIHDLAFVNGQADNNSDPGGAILINGGKLKILNSLFKGNVAEEGGAIYIAMSSRLEADNCTFTENRAVAWTGAAISCYGGSADLARCVLVNNRCGTVSSPAAIFNSTPLNSNTSTTNIYLKNTIVALNTYDETVIPGLDSDIFGAVYTSGGNVIGSYPVVQHISLPEFKRGTPNTTGDYVGTRTTPVDPKVGALAFNGFFTSSYPLLAGSVALLNNAGNSRMIIPAVASNGIVPPAAYPGDRISITGINLSQVNKIQFNGAPQVTTGITATANQVEVNVPANASGGQILLIDPTPNFIFTPQSFRVKTITTPTTPTGVVATALSRTSVKLEWNDVEHEETYHIQYKKSTEADYATAGQTTENLTLFMATGLLCNTKYDFRVIAQGRGTESAPSSAASLTMAGIQAPVLVGPTEAACLGSTVSLKAPDGFDSYKWNSGVTSSSVEISEPGNYSLTVTDNGCESAMSNVVSVSFKDCDVITGMDQRGEFLVYPSPVVSKVIVQSSPTDLIVIYDSRGIEVKRVTDGNRSEVELDVSDLNVGLYVVRSGNRSMKFLKI